MYLDVKKSTTFTDIEPYSGSCILLPSIFIYVRLNYNRMLCTVLFDMCFEVREEADGNASGKCKTKLLAQSVFSRVLWKILKLF